MCAGPSSEPCVLHFRSIPEYVRWQLARHCSPRPRINRVGSFRIDPIEFAQRPILNVVHHDVQFARRILAKRRDSTRQ